MEWIDRDVALDSSATIAKIAASEFRGLFWGESPMVVKVKGGKLSWKRRLKKNRGRKPAKSMQKDKFFKSKK